MNLEFVQTLCEMRPLSNNQLLVPSKHSQTIQDVLDVLDVLGQGSLYFET